MTAGRANGVVVYERGAEQHEHGDRYSRDCRQHASNRGRHGTHRSGRGRRRVGTPRQAVMPSPRRAMSLSWAMPKRFSQSTS